MHLDALVFDLDGTLGETMPICFRAFRALFREELGREYRDDEILAMFGPSEEGVIARALPGRAEEALVRYIELYELEHRSCAAPFPGIRELLEAAGGRGVRLFLVTAKGPRSAAVSLRMLGLEDVFEQVVAGRPEGNRKAENIRRVLDEAGLAPARAAYVGDAPSDVRAAREAGVAAISVAWAETADRGRLVPEEPDRLFETVAELQSWLEACRTPGRGA